MPGPGCVRRGDAPPGASPDPPHLNARYYDPKLGFGGKTLSHSVFYSPSLLQPDWFEVTAAGVGTNRYAYAGGDYRWLHICLWINYAIA